MRVTLEDPSSFCALLRLASLDKTLEGPGLGAWLEARDADEGKVEWEWEGAALESCEVSDGSGLVACDPLGLLDVSSSLRRSDESVIQN